MAWDLLILPAPTADSPSLLTPRPWGDHIPLLLFWAWNPLIRPRGLDMAIQEYHKRSDWSLDHNGHYLSSWNDLTMKKFASKSSAVSAQEGGILYWPAWWVAYERKSGRAQSPVCSQWSTPPHPSWTQPELHHLDTVCWISKLSFQCDTVNAPFQKGRALSHPSVKVEHALPKGAGPLKRGALSQKGRTLSKGARPLKRGTLSLLSNSEPRT
jgi:hypothetical protein